MQLWLYSQHCRLTVKEKLLLELVSLALPCEALLTANPCLELPKLCQTFLPNTFSVHFSLLLFAVLVREVCQKDILYSTLEGK